MKGLNDTDRQTERQADRQTRNRKPESHLSSLYLQSGVVFFQQLYSFQRLTSHALQCTSIIISGIHEYIHRGPLKKVPLLFLR